jgi:excisionase family DNA binding protein
MAGFSTDWLGKRVLMRIGEVQEVLGCSRNHVYDLLASGRLQAFNPRGAPGTRGTRVVAASVTEYLKAGTITADSWSEGLWRQPSEPVQASGEVSKTNIDVLPL